jgi:hypothetical protein
MAEDDGGWACLGRGDSARPLRAPRKGAYNFAAEQRRAVTDRHRASGSPGVVIQGRQNGKSHTIANLISHFWRPTTGLVTAQSAQALEVLRDKMPGDLQQLCVTLLGDSRASDRACGATSTDSRAPTGLRLGALQSTDQARAGAHSLHHPGIT